MTKEYRLVTEEEYSKVSTYGDQFVQIKGIVGFQFFYPNEYFVGHGIALVPSPDFLFLDYFSKKQKDMFCQSRLKDYSLVIKGRVIPAGLEVHKVRYEEAGNLSIDDTIGAVTIKGGGELAITQNEI
jgi:hypothetical protein